MIFAPWTPEQTDAVRGQLQRTGDLLRRFLDEFAAAARRWVAPALRAVAAMARLLEERAPAADPLGLARQAAAGPHRPAPTRPAWASPYGPAPRRSR